MLRPIFLFFCFILPLRAAEPKVLVTILPYKFFIEKIAGNTVHLQLLVPPGASPHSYEPTMRQALDISDAVIWFRIGEPIEEQLTAALRSQTPHMQMVDLREGLALLPVSSQECGCQHGGYDPHIWLSPHLMIKQVERITTELKKKFPRNAAQYQKNSEELIVELYSLDTEIRQILMPLKNRVILASHPTYGYFCHDYDLKQIAIEVAGKEPSPQQLTRLVKAAYENHIKRIFTQIQHPMKASHVLAKQLNAEEVLFDPMSENYLSNMLKLAHLIAESKE